MTDKNRITKLNKARPGSGMILYWMSRDQRVHDNWALLFAQEIALERKVPLGVVFCLVPKFLDAALRQYEFMLKGLQEVQQTLRDYRIPFHLITGSPNRKLPSFIKRIQCGTVVTDFSPLRIQRSWKEEVSKAIDVPLYEVDAHNIVPCRYTSDKQEFGAYTIRPKIHRQLHTYLVEFPNLKNHPYNDQKFVRVDWKMVRDILKVDTGVVEVNWLKPGEKAGLGSLTEFINYRLTSYGSARSDPNRNAVSRLSPYIHFGQISAQRVALGIKSSRKKKQSREAFLEELIVRRELSDNFCFYNEKYDSFDGFPAWAQKTLNEHRGDKREFIYSVDDFEQAKTHDLLWNAAQIEMVETGWMHGYLRMYWAKKILEWTESPEEALEIGVYLNDKYELDGRDPNGYAGVAWCVGGVHDRAWGERPVIGKIRYMNYKGCKRKFDVEEYIGKFRV
jgi:deoxyribodipyrimidine photo-lyase